MGNDRDEFGDMRNAHEELYETYQRCLEETRFYFDRYDEGSGEDPDEALIDITMYYNKFNQWCEQHEEGYDFQDIPQPKRLIDVREYIQSVYGVFHGLSQGAQVYVIQPIIDLFCAIAASFLKSHAYEAVPNEDIDDVEDVEEMAPSHENTTLHLNKPSYQSVSTQDDDGSDIEQSKDKKISLTKESYEDLLEMSDGSDEEETPDEDRSYRNWRGPNDV